MMGEKFTIWYEVIDDKAKREPGEPPPRRGYRLMRGYSTECPEGEYGIVPVSTLARPITKTQFEMAREKGWPDISPAARSDGGAP
jgi:hypothetical protein